MLREHRPSWRRRASATSHGCYEAASVAGLAADVGAVPVERVAGKRLNGTWRGELRIVFTRLVKKRGAVRAEGVVNVDMRGDKRRRVVNIVGKVSSGLVLAIVSVARAGRGHGR